MEGEKERDLEREERDRQTERQRDRDGGILYTNLMSLESAEFLSLPPSGTDHLALTGTTES